ncbi:hypothetical protein GCM10027562_02290 [Arthrobacter pigmenti]
MAAPGGWTLWRNHNRHFQHHCAVQRLISARIRTEDNPVTEFLEEPDAYVELGVYRRDLRFDDGTEHEMMSFESGESGLTFPGPLIRLKEGQVFHARGPHPSVGPKASISHGSSFSPGS